MDQYITYFLLVSYFKGKENLIKPWVISLRCEFEVPIF